MEKARIFWGSYWRYDGKGLGLLSEPSGKLASSVTTVTEAPW